MHAGSGLSNTNYSLDINWRIMKETLLGCAGKAGGGYNQLRTQNNLTTFIQNDSRASFKAMAEKGQLVSFPTSATYNKAVYDKLQEFDQTILSGARRVVMQSKAGQ